MTKLEATFAELGTRMKLTDVFVFFIAGHGKTVDGHYHFIPYDFRYQNADSILTGGIDQDHFPGPQVLRWGAHRKPGTSWYYPPGEHNLRLSCRCGNIRLGGTTGKPEGDNASVLGTSSRPTGAR